MRERPRLAVSLALVLIASVLKLGGAPLTGSDPYGTAVVAQSILRNHQLTLTGINAQFFRGADNKLPYQVFQIGSRVEYYFPLGTAILALPVVALEDVFGSSPLRHERNIQRHMIFLTLITALAILYRWCRRFFDRPSSLMLSTLGFLGSVAAPTLTSAYWSSNPEIVFAGIAFLMLAKTRLSMSAAVGLGIVLFMGFVCRPTFATIITCIVPALAIRTPRACGVTSATAMLLLIGFVLFSEHHYGAYLPPY